MRVKQLLITVMLLVALAAAAVKGWTRSQSRSELQMPGLIASLEMSSPNR